MTKRLLGFSPRRLAILSRGEKAQGEMKQMFPESQYPCMRYLVGDVRDEQRLELAFKGCDYVIHAAALKEVPVCERAPIEATNTNVTGAINVIRAATQCGVSKVVAISTDKAAAPVTTYGATKLLADKLFTYGNAYSAGTTTRFSVVRYGNVASSRGSVIPFFVKQRETGELTITHPQMSRFWLSLDEAVDAVFHTFNIMQGGEIVIPKMPSFRIMDLAEAIAPNARFRIIGIRECEKIDEQMWHEGEAAQVLEYDGYYVMYPSHHSWTDKYERLAGGRPAPEGWAYKSSTNTVQLTVDDIQSRLESLQIGCA